MRAVAGDVTTDGLGLDEPARQLLSECDIVVHSAAAVSFDSPLDTAVEVNLLGPSRVAAAVLAARLLAAEQGRTGPVHYLPVSTAYVAGTHQGEAKEELLDGNRFTVDVDWRDEVDAARRQRADLDADSRRPERLDRFAKQARGELGGGRAPPAGRAGRADPRGLGQIRDGRASARPAPSRSAGPTPIPTPRPSASGRWCPSSAAPCP